jgi:hypothetical protein
LRGQLQNDKDIILCYNEIAGLVCNLKLKKIFIVKNLISRELLMGIEICAKTHVPTYLR